MQFSWSYLERTLPHFWRGFVATLEVGAAAFLVATLIAMLLVAIQYRGHRWMVAPIAAVVDFLRYTPVLVQLYLFYFGLPLIGVDLSALWCGAIAIGLQQGCYASEVLRSGISGVDPKQREAAEGLGLTRLQVLRLIVLPQAFIKSLPSLVNQTVLLLKDTTIVSAIGIMETTLVAKSLAEQSGATIPLFALAALMFLILTSLLGLIARMVETNLKRKVGI